MATEEDRYSIEEKIGSGGMGTVYRARDQQLQREVALKFLPEYSRTEVSFVERFRREAQTIGRLEHPHIIPIYDVGEQQGYPYIVMRLMTGGTLGDQLRRPDFTLGNLIQVLGQVADALDAAHAHNIVHRDIKPGNILFDDYGTAYLSDFGIAKVLDSSTQLTGSGLIGTPAYMSPEQFIGEHIDGRSDQYSLAIVVYEIFAGRLPFGGNTAQMMYNHLNTMPPEIQEVDAHVPAGLNTILRKALSKQPQERYRTVADFVAALRAVVAVDPTIVPGLPLALATEPTAFATSPAPTDAPNAPSMAAAAVASAESQTSVHYRRGLEAMDQGDWEVATAAFAMVVAINPDYRNAQRLKRDAETKLTAASAAAATAAGAGVMPTDPTVVEPPVAAAAFGAAAVATPAASPAVTPPVVAPPATAPAGSGGRRLTPFLIIGGALVIVVLLLIFGLPFLQAQLGGGRSDDVAEATVTTESAGVVVVPSWTPGPTDTAEPTAEATEEVVVAAVATEEPIATALPPTATATAEPTEAARPAVTITQPSINVRRGPDVTFNPPVGFLFAGDTVEVIARDDTGDWYLVELPDGGLGWVSRAVVVPVDAAALNNVPPAATIPARPTLTPTPTRAPTRTPTPFFVPPPATPGGGSSGGGSGNGGGNDQPPKYTPEPP